MVQISAYYGMHQMANEFYNRQVEILIDGQPLINDNRWRIIFQVTQDYGGFVSYCDLSIYGLATESIGRVTKPGIQVAIRAGYENNSDFIFKGALINPIQTRQGPDKFVQLLCRGGGMRNRTIQASLGADTTVVSIIRECANAIGLPLVIKESDFSNDPPYAKGATLFGDPVQYLNDLARTHNFSYAVTNDKIRVVKNTGFIDESIREVSQFTGMIGIPEISENGCDVNITLNPKVKIGGRINIVSEFKTFNFSNVYYRQIPPNAGSGIYRIFKIIHSGDTWGNNWRSSLTGFR